MVNDLATASPINRRSARPVRLLFLLAALGALIAVFLYQRRPVPIPNVGREKLLFPQSEAALRLRKAVAAAPNDAALRLQYGDALAERGFFMAALREFRAALQHGAQTAETHRKLAQTYEWLSRRAEAAQEYRLAQQLEPQNPLRQIEWGRAVFREGKHADARPLLDAAAAQIERVDPSQQYPFWRALGATYVEMNDGPRCLQVADKILALTPGEPSALEIKGQVLFSRGETARALPFLRQALAGLENPAVNAPPAVLANLHYLLGVALYETDGGGRNPQVLVHLARAVQLNPGLAWAHYSLGRVYADQQRWPAAAEAFLQARALGVETADLLRRAAIAHRKNGDIGGSLLLKGLYHQAQGEEAKALETLAELRKDPAYAEGAALQIARIHRQRRRHDKALAVLQELVRSHPQSVQGYQAIAEVYGDKQDFPQRSAALDRVAALDPAYKDFVLREKGAWYFSVQKLDEAERCFAECIRLRPMNAAYHFAIARAYLPQTSRKEKLPQAIEALERALTLEPNQASGYRLYGLALQQAGQMEAAARALEHCIDLQPGFGDAYAPLIQVYRSLNQGKEAQEIATLSRRYQQFHSEQAELQRRVITQPDDRPARLALARFYMAARDYERAAEQLKKAISLDPKDPKAQEGLAFCFTQLGMPFEASVATQKALRLRLTAARPGSRASK